MLSTFMDQSPSNPHHHRVPLRPRSVFPTLEQSLIEADCYIPQAIFLFMFTNPFSSHDCLLDTSPDSFLAYLTTFLSS